MQWKVHGHQTLYTSDWVNLELADVELPDGRRFDHHVLRMPRQTVAVAVVRDNKVLMLWRHRFITDRWGWELPAGWVDPGEDPATAARREVEEETGWQPGPLTLIANYCPDHGISDSRFNLYRADSATQLGAPTDPSEASRIEWVSLTEVRALIAKGEIDDGASLTALLSLLVNAGEGGPSGDRGASLLDHPTNPRRSRRV